MQARFSLKSLKQPWLTLVCLVGLVVLAGLVVMLAARSENAGPAIPAAADAPRIDSALLETAQQGTSSLNGDRADGSPTDQNQAEAAEDEVRSDADRPDEIPAPELVISVNGYGEVEVFRGWPLFLDAELLHPGLDQDDIDQTPMLLAAKEGPWSNALQITVKDEHGRQRAWPFEFAMSPAETFSLDVQRFARLVWSLAPEETAEIAEGNYQIVAILDTRESLAEGGWKGILRSDPVTVRVHNEPSPLSREQESEKYQLLAVISFLRGDRNQAMALAEALLKSQPDDVGALEIKADLLARDGKHQEALDVYGRAISAFYKRYGAEEPPGILLQKQRRIRDKLFAQEAPQGLVETDGEEPFESLLAERTLRGETRAGEPLPPPFPKNVGRLVFVWKLPDSFRDDPAEVYWFAADTGGAAPTNYMIASDESKPGAVSGTFSLSAPNKGFPPGTYRLELRQAGSVLHREQFTIAAAEAPDQSRPVERTERNEARLAAHSLSAETVAGMKIELPLPADSKRLVFTWTLSDAAPQEPIEGRWIAAETGGAVPPDYVIASSKTEPAKPSGQFTLSAPKNGFPPGAYRLELWCGGTLIHREQFNIVK